MQRAALLLTTIASLLAIARPLQAQPQFPAASFVGRPVASLVLRIEGRPAQDPALLELVETPVGEPLSMDRVRETMRHLFELGRFEGVEVLAEDAPGGQVALAYELRPLHAVAELRFRGETGLGHGELRRVIVDRYSKAPPPGRADAAARTLEQYLSRHGFLRARVTPGLEVRHDPDRTVLVFTVQAGPRARVGRVNITGVADTARLADRLDLSPGATFDFDRLDERVSSYVQSLRKSGYYEATVDHRAEPRENRAIVDVSVDVNRGPVVKLAFEGDPLPRNRVADLVPVEREGSVDEDLLEDSDIRIREFLLEQGHARAQISHRRERRDGTETITFTIRRGPRYLARNVEIAGNASIPIEQLRALVTLQSGEPFVERRLTAATNAIKSAYARQGFGSAAIDAATSDVPPAAPGEDGFTDVRINVREGSRTRVGTIVVEGNATLTSDRLRGVMKVSPGDPFSEAAVAADKEAVLREYLNEGFSTATVAVETRPAPDSRMDLHYRIVENQPVIVDHIIIVGNTRTSEETIRRELLLEPGKPLGYDDLVESQRRLSALGLFRRVRITEAPHGDDPRRDIIVTVEEANRTTIAYGGGAEITPLTVAGAGGLADQEYDIAPRGSFEITRRNLWGKNRSVSLFTRLSLRSRGEAVEGASSYGLNEYRVVGTFRELGALHSRVDIANNAFVEQAVRSSFNFRRQGFNAEMLRRVTPFVRFSARYTLGRTELLDAESIPDELRLDVDRAFPQVRLSTFATALYRDTRDNPLEPTRGTLLSEDTDLALRSIGSQVGFGKVFVQGLLFRTVSRQRGVVFAGAARLGLARAFPREIDGTPVGADLPASERFFAGGSTTVRGFALDRLGTDQTISGCAIRDDEPADPDAPCAATGFPLGGNGMLVLNAELRVPLWRDIGVVGFMDAGNVFALASDVDLTELRFSPGFGIRYRSPIGPVRIDVGFKLDRRELSPGRFEAPHVFHISVGHAF